MTHKIPVSVLVVIHTLELDVLLTRLNRVWHKKQVFREIDQACMEKDYLRAAVCSSGSSTASTEPVTDCQKPGWPARSISKTSRSAV